MPNRRGLGKSRKFASGTAHENGTGKFVILNRYEGEDGKPMLEFQWQTGERAGEIDTNTEANVNSAIHKFQIYRKGAGKEVVSHVNVDDLPIMEKIDTLYTRQTEIFERFDEVTDMLGQQQEAIVSLSEQLARMVDHHGLLLKQQETLNKLIEKM